MNTKKHVHAAVVVQHQPASGGALGEEVWPLVLKDLKVMDPRTSEAMQARVEFGRQKYGTTLRTFNGRDALVDAFQEELDGVVYLRQHIQEGQVAGVDVRRELELYNLKLYILSTMVGLIYNVPASPKAGPERGPCSCPKQMVQWRLTGPEVAPHIHCGCGAMVATTSTGCYMCDTTRVRV